MKRIKYRTPKEVRNLLMLPNGKQPLSAYEDWKPSDGCSEPKQARWLHNTLCIALVVVLVMIVAAVNR